MQLVGLELCTFGVLGQQQPQPEALAPLGERGSAAVCSALAHLTTQVAVRFDRLEALLEAQQLRLAKVRRWR